jgi:4'-phosphopantetheinyl transferase
MTLQTVLLPAPAGVTARLGWDPGTTVHDRRRIIAKELIAAKLGCEPTDVRIEREAPRGFGYHTRLIASRDGEELPIAIVTASFRAATVVAICDPGLPLGIDIRDAHPEPADLRLMRKHSHLSTRTTSTCCSTGPRAGGARGRRSRSARRSRACGSTRRVSTDGSATAT